MFDQPLIIGKVAVAQSFHQLGILILDGSGSMQGSGNGNVTKADEVNIAVRDLLTRFKASRMKNNFSFAALTFDTKTQIRTPITPAATIDDNDDYNPMPGHGGGTNIGVAMQEAWQMGEAFLNAAPADGVKHSVILLILSDGGCQYPQQTTAVAKQIKTDPRVTVCAALFNKIGERDAAGQAMLRGIVSNPVLDFKDVYDAESLRAFFEKSISRASGVVIA